MMETNGDGWTDAESLQFLLLQFILYIWLRITLLNTNLTMSLLCLINHYCFPKDLRIMFYLENPLRSGPPYFSGLICYHFSIALFTLVNSQESRATSLLRADYPLLSRPALFPLLWTPGWFLLILQDSTLTWLPLGSLSWLPSQAGFIFCPSGHPALYYRSQQNRKNMNSEIKETWI